MELEDVTKRDSKMTIGQRRRRKSASVKKIFAMTDKQKAKMHETAQWQLFQMSDVQGELHKKQPPKASRKRRAAERDRYCTCAGAYDQPQVRRKRRNISLEEKGFVKKKGKNIDKEPSEEQGNASGEIDHLLILANSVELMESEGYMEKPPDTTQDYSVIETEKSSLRVRGRVRLTHIKHLARLENSQQIHDTHIGYIPDHANLKLGEETKGCENVDTNQIRAMDDQKDQDPHVLAKNGNAGTVDINLLTFESESTEVNNEKLQESLEHHLTISQPILMTTEHGKFTQKKSDTQQLRIANRNDSLKAHILNEKKEHRHTPLGFHAEQSAALVKKSEAEKVRRSIAREKRKLRVLELRKQRHNKQFQWIFSIQVRQMLEAQRWWAWYVINATSQLTEIAKQHKALYMSYVAREQRRVSARKRRAEKIQEKRAKKMHWSLKNRRPVECHSGEVPNESNVGMCVEQSAIPFEEDQTATVVCEDQYGKLQQQTTIVDYEEKASPAGQIRLTQLKREARFKHSAIKMEKLTQQVYKEDESASN